MQPISAKWLPRLPTKFRRTGMYSCVINC